MKFELKDLNIHNIETIKIRRHKSIRRGAWIGAATGKQPDSAIPDESAEIRAPHGLAAR